MKIDFLVFLMKTFHFSKFHENEAKHDKLNLKRGLTLTFKVKNSNNYWKNWLTFLKAYFFVGK